MEREGALSGCVDGEARDRGDGPLRVPGDPAPGSQLDSLLHEMIVPSDDSAANSLLVWLGGSTSSGAYHVNDLMRSIGLTDTLMYGGYLTRTLSSRIRSVRTRRRRSASASTRPPGT